MYIFGDEDSLTNKLRMTKIYVSYLRWPKMEMDEGIHNSIIAQEWLDKTINPMFRFRHIFHPDFNLGLSAFVQFYDVRIDKTCAIVHNVLEDLSLNVY